MKILDREFQKTTNDTKSIAGQQLKPVRKGLASRDPVVPIKSTLAGTLNAARNHIAYGREPGVLDRRLPT